MEWVASTLHTTSEQGVPSITTADAHTSAASSRRNWRPRRCKWTRPFWQKTKSGFWACAITFQTHTNAGYTKFSRSVKGFGYPLHSPVSPSLPLPCVAVCHHVSTGLYLANRLLFTVLKCFVGSYMAHTSPVVSAHVRLHWIFWGP